MALTLGRVLITDCVHSEGRGPLAPEVANWGWCTVRARELYGQADCRECRSYVSEGDEVAVAEVAAVDMTGDTKPKEREATAMAVSTEKRGFNWDGPAEGVPGVTDARDGELLWEWAERIGNNATARALNCAPSSVSSVVKTRRRRQAKAGRPADGSLTERERERVKAAYGKPSAPKAASAPKHQAVTEPEPVAELAEPEDGDGRSLGDVSAEEGVGVSVGQPLTGEADDSPVVTIDAPEVVWAFVTTMGQRELFAAFVAGWNARGAA